MSIFYVDKTEGSDVNALIYAFAWFNNFKSEEKSIIFNDKNNFMAVLKDLGFDDTNINRIWKEKKLTYAGSTSKIYTIKTLPTNMHGIVMTIYLMNPLFSKIRESNSVENILAVPWLNEELLYLISIGAIKI